MLIRSWFIEKYLNIYQYKKRKLLLLRCGREFMAKEGQIISLLKKTEFYHGTGAYHYRFSTSKYEESEPKVSYSLRQIIRHGLTPQLDLFNETFKTKASRTTSLTTNRIYARGYAQMFFPENEPLEYAYGPLNLWLYHIAKRVIVGFLRHNMSIRKMLSTQENEEARKRYVRTFQHWTRSFRKDGRYEGRSVLAQMNGRTDIPNNFGIIIGTKKKSVGVIRMKYPGLEKDEARTDRPIFPSDFSHIQAPLRYLNLVKEECKQAKLELPIIPIEFVELHNYKLGLRRLIRLAESKSGSPLSFS